MQQPVSEFDAFDNIEEANESIKKGERSRILFELLLSEIGGSYEDTRSEVWEKLKRVQEEYEEAIKLLTTVIQEKARLTNKKASDYTGITTQP